MRTALALWRSSQVSAPPFTIVLQLIKHRVDAFDILLAIKRIHHDCISDVVGHAWHLLQLFMEVVTLNTASAFEQHIQQRGTKFS